MDIREQTSQILHQVAELVGQLSNEQYIQSMPVLTDNSVGKHIRHIVVFYQCLLNGVSAGQIDYDKRERNLLLETDRNYALHAIREITNATEIIHDNSLTLNMAYGDGICTVNTSIFRELAYNIEHVIHHLAIIKIGIKTHYAEFSLPENLGVAYPTIKYQQQQVAKDTSYTN